MAGTSTPGPYETVIEYHAGDARLLGQLVAPTDDAGAGPPARRRPGVLVFPEWWGASEHAHDSARRLAQAGYVALVADMYGDGRATSDAEEAARWSADTRIGPLSRARSRAAFDQLTHHPAVDPDRTAAIGFCFGGDVALELARDGAPLRGVVAFHAALASGEPAQPGTFHPEALVLHGADDPLTPPERVAAFADEMRAAGARWELAAYGGAVHSFTNPAADDAGLDGVAYHPVAARRAWAHHLTFLAEVLEND